VEATDLKDLSVSDLVALGERPRKVKPVDLPGLGRVYVGRMTATERDEWSASGWATDADGQPVRNRANATGRLLACCLCDGKGKRLFNLADAEQLGKLPGPVTDKIGPVALAWNGLTEAEVEDAEKNSEPAPSVGSSSGSPATSE
jgi:hypothetical protein